MPAVLCPRCGGDCDVVRFSGQASWQLSLPPMTASRRAWRSGCRPSAPDHRSPAADGLGHRRQPLSPRSPRSSSSSRARTRSAHLLDRCRELPTSPLTFRAAGTSLSGQAITDSVLAVLGDAWNWARIEADGGAPPRAPRHDRRRMQPPPRYPTAARSAPTRPRSMPARSAASSTTTPAACAAASAQNTYHTMEALRFMLADGTVLDTGDADQPRRVPPEPCGLLNEIDAMAREVKADEALRRAHPPQVPHQMHHRLQHQRFRRLRRSDRRPGPSDGRLRRHARLRLRGQCSAPCRNTPTRPPR